MARFSKAAQFVAERLRRELRAAAVRRYLLSFRAKHPDDFAGKLRRKRSKYSYAALSADLNSVLTDLAGCRIIVYHATDVRRVVEVAKVALPLAQRADA